MKPGALLLTIGGLLGATGVVAGALAAHLVDGNVSEELRSAYHLAVRYQMLHAIAIVAIAGAASHFNRGRLLVAGYLMALGIILFAGSLYVMVLLETRALGFVMPVGGLLLITGWLTVALGAWKPSGQGSAQESH